MAALSTSAALLISAGVSAATKVGTTLYQRKKMKEAMAEQKSEADKQAAFQTMEADVARQRKERVETRRRKKFELGDNLGQAQQTIG